MLDFLFDLFLDVFFVVVKDRNARRFVLAGVLAAIAYAAGSMVAAIAVWVCAFLLMEFLGWPFAN